MITTMSLVGEKRKKVTFDIDATMRNIEAHTNNRELYFYVVLEPAAFHAVRQDSVPGIRGDASFQNWQCCCAQYVKVAGFVSIDIASVS